MNQMLMSIIAASLVVLPAVAKRPPNIIVIMVDDMGSGGLSCYDNEHFKTPEIDQLAADGLLLSDFHSNGAVCSPTRAALLTGRYQQRSGCHVVVSADPKSKDHSRGLPAAEWTMSEALKEGGYATAIFGKWHIGYKPEFNPLRHGFDQFNGFISGNIDSHSHYDRMETFDWWDGEKLKDEPGYQTDLITEHTLEFIKRHKEQPFFIYAAHGSPHGPLMGRGSKIIRGPKKGTVPEWGQGMPQSSKIVGNENWIVKQAILPVDEGVGRIRRQIEELGLSEDTIIWFISDNGGTKFNYTMTEKNRGGKGDLYEGGHRVPGIVWAPGRITPGISPALVVGMDIMPTSLAMANISIPEGRQLDGIDVSGALFKGNALPERSVFWGHVKKKTLGKALRKGPWKLVNNELYNLSEDPQEKNDLAAKYPERVAEMVAACEAIYSDVISDSPYDQ